VEIYLNEMKKFKGQDDQNKQVLKARMLFNEKEKNITIDHMKDKKIK